MPIRRARCGSCLLYTSIAGAFATALPGIVLQLVLIPVVMVGLEHAGVLRDTV